MNFLTQMAAHARDILNFKYCKDTNGGNRERAEEIIRAVTKCFFFVPLQLLLNSHFTFSARIRILCYNGAFSCTV